MSFNIGGNADRTETEQIYTDTTKEIKTIKVNSFGVDGWLAVSVPYLFCFGVICVPPAVPQGTTPISPEA